MNASVIKDGSTSSLLMDIIKGQICDKVYLGYLGLWFLVIFRCELWPVIRLLHLEIELKLNACHLMNNVLHSINIARLVRVLCGFLVEIIAVRNVWKCNHILGLTWVCIVVTQKYIIYLFFIIQVIDICSHWLSDWLWAKYCIGYIFLFL